MNQEIVEEWIERVKEWIEKPGASPSFVESCKERIQMLEKQRGRFAMAAPTKKGRR